MLLLSQIFEFLTILHPESLYLSKCLFRLIGITTNNHDRKLFIYFGTILVVAHWSAIVGAIFKVVMTVHQNKDFSYSNLGMLIWIIYTSFSYTFIYLQMNFGKNLFLFIEEISKPETNDYGKIRSPLYRPSNLQTLNQISTIWISLSAIFTLSATSASLIIFGPIQMVKDTVPSFGNDADGLYLFLLFISNITCPIPMIIVRLGSYFTESRILGMIHYLESENEHLHAVPIASIMGWYDDVYRVNVQLEKVVSPYVTCALLIMLPQAVFLLQGIFLHELQRDEAVCLFIWLIYALFMLLVICCSVAQLDSLNRRFEIALGCIVSRNEFASSETTNAFDLAMAKARSLPFGIHFYATRARISYSSIYKIGTIIISTLLFFFGYS